MKNLFLFLLPLLILSCKSNVETHRASIEELSGNWDNTTKEITDFQTMVSTDLTSYTQKLAAMQPDEATMATMTPEKVTAWETAQKGVTDALGAYAPLQQTVNDFVTEWTAKSAEVTALKDGLASGKLEGDVDAKVAELNAMVATANENLTAWKASYSTVKGQVDAAYTALQNMAAPVNASPMRK